MGPTFIWALNERTLSRRYVAVTVLGVQHWARTMGWLVPSLGVDGGGAWCGAHFHSKEPRLARQS